MPLEQLCPLALLPSSGLEAHGVLSEMLAQKGEVGEKRGGMGREAVVPYSFPSSLLEHVSVKGSLVRSREMFTSSSVFP